jgi:thiosulfate/3-mercaptopyruvate sulfurtransferase
VPYSTLIDTTPAHDHLGDPGWVFIDCRFDIRNPTRGRQDYHTSHVRGAAYADLDQDLSGPIVPGRTGRHPLPDPESIVRVFSGWGIGPQTQVIAYDESTGAMAAARLWWLLKWAGHDAVAVLEGGFKAWTAARMPRGSGVESGPTTARFVAGVQARAGNGCA